MSDNFIAAGVNELFQRLEKAEADIARLTGMVEQLLEYKRQDERRKLLEYYSDKNWAITALKRLVDSGDQWLDLSTSHRSAYRFAKSFKKLGFAEQNEAGLWRATEDGIAFYHELMQY